MTDYKNPYIYGKHVVNAYDGTAGFNPQYGQMFLQICDEVSSGTDRLARNYSRSAFDFSNHMTIDMLLDDNGELVELEGVYRRDWWPGNVWRIKNRFYSPPPYRHPGLQFNRPKEQRILTTHQIKKAIANGANALFVSIEGPKAFTKMKVIMKTMVPYWGVDLEWKMPGRYFKVADCDSKPCWQQIIYANVKPNYDLSNERWFQESMTMDQWKELPE